MTKQVEMKTYLITTRKEKLKITVPENYKVTFGPVAVGNSARGGSLALRFYESDTKQRAIFTDVLSFKDCSIPVERLVVKKDGEDKYSYDSKGKSTLEEKASVTETWEEVEY